MGSTRQAREIEVRPEHRRLGYAQRAFEAIEEEAGRLGLAGIALHVFGHNTAAQLLYARLGDLPTDTRMYKPLGGNGADAAELAATPPFPSTSPGTQHPA